MEASSRTKRLRPLHFNDYSEISKTCDISNQGSDEIQNYNSVFSEHSKSNKVLKFGLVSPNPTLMCSHEKIEIKIDVESSGSSSVDEKSNKINNKERNRQTEKTNIINFQTDIKEFDRSKTEQLLSMDNSFLNKVDLSSQVDNNIKLNGISGLSGSNHLNLRVSSPDLFYSNDEKYEELIDSEDQAWDMSISVNEDKKNQSLSLENINKDVIPEDLSSIQFSSWESPLRTKNSGTLECLLKTALANNAHKTISHHSSPDNKKFGNDGELFFGLPWNVKRLIKRCKGIDKLYEWQEECLKLPAVEKRKNLVYALPTSGGKTLVAEILVLKEILCREKNVLFVLPYVSIAQEKVRAFSPFAVELGFNVEEYAGSKGAYPPQKRRRKRSVYVATIEKALGLVHSLIECQRIQELGLIVVDELHLLGEPKRGSHLESMLIKLIHFKSDIQIVGMSATIGNLPDIAKFLHADVYTQQFRPVELTEYVKVEDELFKVDYSVNDDVPLLFHSKMIYEDSQQRMQQDPDKIGALVKEVIPEHSCLVFCPSKKNCENVALLICNSFDKTIAEHMMEEKKALFRALLAEGNGNICPILRKTVPFGVAYHHSGLTTAERSLLEEAFLAKTIFCICCTSTLAAGVNLPARRVILRSPYIGTQLITLSKYKQMVGRAGRTGMGDVGESFLLCKPQDAQKVGELLSSAMDLCVSQLLGTGLESLVISAVDLSLTPSVDSLLAFCNNSLLSVQASTLGVNVAIEVEATLERLIDIGALTRNGNSLALSRIGKAAVKVQHLMQLMAKCLYGDLVAAQDSPVLLSQSYIARKIFVAANVDTEMAKRLYGDLVAAQDSLVLLSHLHLLYLITPYNMMEQISFQKQPFCSAYMQLGAKEIQAAKVVGIGEHCIAQLMAGRSIKESQYPTLHRFYLSLILFDLWSQTSIWQVANKYLLPRGLVHNLLISASAFSASVVRFCEVLDDMWCFKLLLSEMSSRLTHCCTLELLPLMELPAVKIGRAKQLFNAGFKTLNILAKTEPKALVQAVDHMPRRVAHQIVAAAKLLLLSKAESLQEEAEAVLEGL